MKFHHDRTKTKKLWLSIIPAVRRFYQPRLGKTQKRCEPQLFLASLGQVIRCSKALNLGSLNMQFQHEWPKDKKLQLFYFFCLKTEKYRRLSFMMRLERDQQFFLYRNSTSRTPLYTSGLAELKHAFFSRTGRNNKNLQRSNLFQLTIFKHGLLGVNWCEVQLFFAAPPHPKYSWKALD